MSATAELITLEQAHTSGVYPKREVLVVRGKGARVWDGEGREYIDCVGGHGSAILGHGDAGLLAAISGQAQRLLVCPEGFYNDVRARFLEALAGRVPPGLGRFFLCNSGAEAVEAALKFARLVTGRPGVIAAMRGFHGRTMGALSATWERKYREPFVPLVPGFQHVPFNRTDAVEEALNDGTGAVLVEVVQGEGGVHVARKDYLAELGELCRRRGVLLILDEVQTGFGRTGEMFACQHYGVTPDLLCMGKGMAGGVPVGAVAIGERVGEIPKLVHGSTFGGNPLACAAGLAVLDRLEERGLVARARELGQRFMERLRRIESPLVREVRGLGLLVGMELKVMAGPYLRRLMELGVLALPAGGTVIRFLPPLVVEEEDLDLVAARVEEVLSGC